MSSWEKRLSSYGFPTGLRNLGNTCFMNSALQCLAAVQPLADIFLNDLKINGYNQNAAEVVVAVLEFFQAKSKQNSSTIYSPYLIKDAIGRVANRFQGYEQQDAFELMTVLLNALADGLNRIPQPVKLAPEDINYQDMSVEEKYQYSLSRFALRQKSEIVDLFYGFHKNVIKCQNGECSTERHRFQPYGFLSVPIRRPSFTIHCIHETRMFIYQPESRKEEWTSPIGSLKFPFQMGKKLVHVKEEIFKRIKDYGRDGHFYILQRDHSLATLHTDNVEDIPSGTILIFHITSSPEMPPEGIQGNLQNYKQDSLWSNSRVKVLTFLPKAINQFHEHYTKRPMSVQKAITARFESFRDSDAKYKSSSQIKQKSDPMSIEECIKLFTSPSLLSEDSTWTCSSCKQDPGLCTFQTLIWTLPPVLIIHLRRFKAVESYAGMRMEKIDSLVSYEEYLDMKPFTEKTSNDDDENKYLYRLVSVSRHHGSLFGGHYNANAYDGKNWHHYDDSHVSNSSLQRVLNDSAALFLIYVRNSLVSPRGNVSYE